MFSDDTRKRLENIIQGVSITGEENSCTAIRNFLSASFGSGRTTKKDFESKLVIKKEQEKLIKQFADNYSLWVEELPNHNQFIAKGGESSVYLDKDRRHVIKINDAILCYLA